ncbi:flagellar basal body rod protein FlgB [Trichococcus sp. K1Tr]|uniref:flagellar basal body rod protein FlgB n=1 Tax=Trichococcus sp. K1Tr TaxID=3020847 RepID=UPI0023312C95|nr:flagellar basal body rod protein FlgB [Trichococcus sp. K1Tr]MDB6353458.1 flagellar basal body rod protein FlgB [Trichococcus sp. K1Tr]
MNDINYNLLRNALNAASTRQEVISSNISNVNTDNYKVGQVQFESLLVQANQSLSMKQTNDLHIGFDDLSKIDPLVTKRTDTAVKENGNNVDIDMEMANQAQNSLYYNALVTQLNAKYGLLNTAISS